MLLTCPTCQSYGRRTILGSLSVYGLIIQRYTKGGQTATTTIVLTQPTQILCQCGFGTVVSQYNHPTINSY
jgi:hypothetical protein